jgi:hypothetical protein
MIPKDIGTSLGSMLLFNSVTQEEKGLSGTELVTYLYAWAYPSSHIVQAVFTIFDVEKGKTLVDFYIKRQNEKIEKDILRLTMTTNNNIPSYSFNSALPLEFQKSGRYYIIATLPEFKSKIEIPIDVITKKWPTFTNREVNFINSNAEKARSIRLNIICKTCNHNYVFEEKLNKTEPISPGALQFPESGHFKCPGCENNIELKDIQGRLRYSIKRLVKRQMELIH